MRITQQMTSNTLKRSVFRQSADLLRKQEILASGKRINRPSDDPIGTGKILDYRKSLAAFEQYGRNSQQAKNRIKFMETTLESVGELVVDAKNWAVNQSGSVATEREAAISSVQNIRDQVLQLANSRIGNNYIFSGYQTNTAPFDSTGLYLGDNGDYRVMTGNNMETRIEADGSRIFQGADDVFAALEDLLTGLQTDDVALISAQVDRLVAVQDQLQLVRAESSAHYQQLELGENQMARLKLTVEDLLASTENAPMESAILELQSQETAYQITLETSARIIQPTLMNFLR